MTIWLPRLLTGGQVRSSDLISCVVRRLIVVLGTSRVGYTESQRSATPTPATIARSASLRTCCNRSVGCSRQSLPRRMPGLFEKCRIPGASFFRTTPRYRLDRRAFVCLGKLWNQSFLSEDSVNLLLDSSLTANPVVPVCVDMSCFLSGSSPN